MNECQTSRAACTRKASSSVRTKCCDKRIILCEQHSQDGKKMWGSVLVTLGLRTFECGYCGREHMPKPEWSAL